MSHNLIASGFSFSPPLQCLPFCPIDIRSRQAGMSGGDQRGRGAEGQTV